MPLPPRVCFRHGQTFLQTLHVSSLLQNRSIDSMRKRLQLKGLHQSFFWKRDLCAMPWKEKCIVGRQRKEWTRERERESEEVENGIRGKLNGIKTHRERRRLSEKGSLASIDGPGREQGPSFISGVCHCGDSCSHQHQPRGIRGCTRGKMKEPKWKTQRIFAVRKSKYRRRRRWPWAGSGWWRRAGGWVEGVTEKKGLKTWQQAAIHPSL